MRLCAERVSLCSDCGWARLSEWPDTGPEQPVHLRSSRRLELLASTRAEPETRQDEQSRQRSHRLAREPAPRPPCALAPPPRPRSGPDPLPLAQRGSWQALVDTDAVPTTAQPFSSLDSLAKAEEEDSKARLCFRSLLVSLAVLTTLTRSASARPASAGGATLSASAARPSAARGSRSPSSPSGPPPSPSSTSCTAAASASPTTSPP